MAASNRDLSRSKSPHKRLSGKDPLTIDTQIASPVTRDDASSIGGSPGFQSPAFSPGIGSGGPALFQGDFTTSDQYVGIKDENSLSSFQYASYKNQGFFFSMLARQTAAMEKMAASGASSKGKTTTDEGKLGTQTEEEENLASDMTEKYKDLIRDAIMAYGDELKKTNEKVTAIAGLNLISQAKVFKERLIAAAPVDVAVNEEDAPSVKGVKESFDGMSDAAVNFFYQSVVKQFVPKAKPHSNKKSASKSTEDTAVKTLSAEPFLSVMKDQFNVFKAGLGSVKPATQGKKVQEQMESFIKQVVAAGKAVDVTADEPLFKAGPELKGLSQSGKIVYFKVLKDGTAASTTPAATTGGGSTTGSRRTRGGNKRIRDDSESDFEAEAEEGEKSPLKKAKQ
ncbi:unnamed protein product [Zymoseptoria tritici ST99CH_1A5]|uniref:Uncharacterized protein n=1 Tax=Zymoseptoria tritici ST99CH_1A5 TaxID=1276529 RepID=A0A1Y6LKX7_ZYMTR|nr:unnamed protein product [Zymoseptoria tritici ST99CH_3D1]SMY24060.1 unnamed protein product [Zymoseptoria tritici ST99CH_1A5]